MRVSLGTLEIDDDTRRALRRDMGRRGGLASRNEVKEHLLGKIQQILDTAGVEVPTAIDDETEEGSED